MLLITVATSVFLGSARRRMSSSPQIAITASPSTTLPCSSETMRRSASPSRAMPRLAEVFFTALHSVSGCSAPKPRLMFLPSGELPMTMTFAPSSSSTAGATR